MVNLVLNMQFQDVYVHPSSFVDEGAQIGSGTKVWHFCHIMPRAVIGQNCSLGQNVLVANDAVLGNGVKVQNNVSVYEGVICEDDVFLGPSMVFTNVMNPRAFIVRRHEFRTTRLCKGASVGANATLVCGITLGEYCFIGAGAVVRADVPAFALMVGVPAKQVGWVSRAGLRLQFDANQEAICPETGEQYGLNADGVFVRS